MKYAIFCKIKRKQDINFIHLKNKKSQYFEKNIRKTVNLTKIDKDLVEILEPLKSSKQSGEYIREALYELIATKYTLEELRAFKDQREELRKQHIIRMKPQIALYTDNERDKEIEKIIKELDKTYCRDEFIKNAIIEKYQRDKK